MSGSIPKRWHIDKSIYDAYKVDCVKMVDTHWHSHFLINIVTDGEGFQEINGKAYPIKRGSITIISPLDFHRNVVLNDEKVSVFAIKFSDKIFYDSLGQICSLEDFPIITALDDESFQTSKTLFELLINEQTKSSRLGSDKFALNLIEQLVILALRANGNTPEEKNISKMRNALAYIHYNFRRDIKASDVASHIGYSPNYFSAEFKKETGLEFRKYLRDLRLDFAHNLIKFSHFSVTEVSFESGFNSLPHFSKAFKEKFGIAPEKIRIQKVKTDTTNKIL